MYTAEYELKGLNCASCASKIEKQIGSISEVEKASLAFATRKLSIEVKDETYVENIIKDIKKIVNSLEPDVEVIDVMDKERMSASTKNQKKLLQKFLPPAFGAVLFAAGFIPSLSQVVKLILFVAGYILAGGDVLYKAAKNIIKGRLFDEDFLMGIATIGAFSIGAYSEAAAVMIFYKAGELLQDIAIDNSRKSIKALIDIRPEYANVKTEKGIVQTAPENVNIGDIILIKPGERVPLDGILIEGTSQVDTSAITGEHIPRVVGKGSQILSGFVNLNGAIYVEVNKSFSQSTVSRILDLVQNAASKKAPAENFITKFAKIYTPIVVALAVVLAIIPPIVTGSLDFSGWLYRALIFLVASCPCALVISIPLSFFGGLGGASRRGILVKGGNYLEALNGIDTVVFDKTGTLTKGVFKVSEIVTKNGFTEDELLKYAALAELHSSHPIAKSILEAFSQAEDLKAEEIQSYEEIPGSGVKIKINDKTIIAGSDKLLHMGSPIEHDTCDIQGTVVHIAVDNNYVGYIVISDEIKDDSERAVTELRKHGIKNIIMLTGDNKLSTNKVADKLGLNEVYSELLPHQKVEQLEKLQLEGKHKVLFVGDGINDAPVLARADIGAAMGALGSDAAIEASDIVLMTDEPSRVAEAISVAKKTRKIVMQNIVFALGVKIIVLALGAGGLANMWEAVFADVGVTLVAVFNSLRAMKK